VSELGEILAGIDSIKLRQSRAIARIVDRRRASLGADPTDEPEDPDAGYDFAVAVIAAATDRSAAEIEELGGSILELGPAVSRIMALAGFAIASLGETVPPDRGPGQAAAGPRTGSGGSMPPSPPAMAGRPH
jgi:hypothetical protein